MTTKAHSDPFAPFVSPLRERRRAAKRLRVRATLLAVAAAIVLFFSSATTARSDEEPNIQPPAPQQEALASEEFIATITGYSSDPFQTDDTPDITASGSHVHDGTLACPTRYAFGTKVEILGKIYTCEDRMAAKYRKGAYFDIWLASTKDAIHLGRVKEVVRVLQ